MVLLQVERGNREVVEELIRAGASVDSQDEVGGMGRHLVTVLCVCVCVCVCVLIVPPGNACMKRAALTGTGRVDIGMGLTVIEPSCKTKLLAAGAHCNSEAELQSMYISEVKHSG